MNTVQLIGRLTAKPELSYTPQNQTAVTRFTLAVDRGKRNGEDLGADFIRIVVWGKQAESSAQYLDKGSQAAIIGKIQTGSYKNKDGATVYTTDVVAERVEFLGGNRNQSQGQQGGYQNNQYGGSDQYGYGGGQAPAQMDMPDGFLPANDADLPWG